MPPALVLLGAGVVGLQPLVPRTCSLSRHIRLFGTSNRLHVCQANSTGSNDVPEASPERPSAQPGDPEPSSSGDSKGSPPDDNNSPGIGPQFLNALVGLLLSIFKRLRSAMLWFVTPQQKFFRTAPGKLLVLLTAFAYMRGMLPGQQKMPANAPTEVLYSQFVSMARQGDVHSALVDDANRELLFVTKPQQVAQAHIKRWRPFRRGAEAPEVAPTQQPMYRAYSTRLIDKDTSFVAHLVDNGVNFGVKKTTFGASLSKALGGFLLLWLPLIPFFFIFRRLMDAQSGKSKDSKQSPIPPDTKFEDVAGLDVVKEELQEAIQCLRNPEKFAKLNASMPSGVLLCGPPGTGKTLLARAVAGEAGVPFFAVSASEFVEMFVGRGAARIRELFAQARKASPAVIFIDELDAVGSQRGLGVNDERDQTLNQLLTELDGFEARPQLLLLAATNRPEVLDKALLRPGRISRRISVPLPDKEARKQILAVHLKKIPMESDDLKAQSIEYLSTITANFSGAELFNVANEAALLAARRNDTAITVTDLISGVNRTRYGVNVRPTPGSKLFGRLAQALRGDAEPEPTKASALL